MVSTPAAVKEIFLAALDKAAPQERAAYLEAACEGDEAVRREVEVLLAAHDQPDSRLDQPPQIARPSLDATSLPDNSTHIGTMVGPYKLLEQIGEGGMGLVYMAEQQRPVRRLVALKVVKPGMDSRQVIARFEAERQALAMMDHPNIARVLEAGTTEAGRPYFVMELVRGIPINEFCDHKRLTVRQRLELMIQVCQAVQHAHQKGIIHRDLKPTNVLVTMHDADAVPKVIDFGIAKALGQQLTDHTLHTGFAQMIGTPLYMSPEQAEMNQFGVDTRSDVYSLGVLLYELLTGTTPFDKDRLTKVGFDEMRRIIREEEPETVSARIARTKSSRHTPCVAAENHSAAVHGTRSVPTTFELDWIVARAIEKDRTRRYESPSALAADIQRYLSGDLVQACPPSPLYRFRKFARKNKTAFTTASLIAASLLLGIILSLWQALRATAAEAQATANAAQASANEARAKVEEQKATALAGSEAALRKQAEKNFAAALDAVDRMLANVSDSELNDVPRVGPLRRKMLKDTIEFYKRIPLQSGVPPQIRRRIANTWDRIAWLCRELDEVEQARQAYKMAIATTTQLVAEQPGSANFRTDLAKFHESAGWFNLHQTHQFEEAEKAFRQSSECFGDLAKDNPVTKSYLVGQSHSLKGLAQALSYLGKQEEAIGSAARALDLLDLSQVATGADRADVLSELAKLQSKASPGESDDLFRRAIVEYRNYHMGRDKPEHNRAQFARILHDTANKFTQRHPDEAEKLWDESIALWREINGASPRVRIFSEQFVHALTGQAQHLRRLTAAQTANEGPVHVGDRQAKAEALFQEAISRQRQMVSRFAFIQDQFRLVSILQEQSKYILGQIAKTGAEQPEFAAARKLQADALLTEAIQLCRALAAEFPDDADYKSRLTALLKLQTQHFGQPKAADLNP